MFLYILSLGLGAILCFAVLVAIRVFTDSTQFEPSGPPKPPSWRSPPTGIHSLFTSGKYSDVTVVCGDRTWELHKSILCSQSDFFAKACDGSFREAREATIDLKDDDESAAAAMLYYLYHGTYSSKNITIPAVLLHVRVYVLADKYFIPELRNKALSNLSEAVKTAWNQDGFTAAVKEIYNNTPRDTDGAKHELRNVVLAVATEHASALFGTRTEHSIFKEMALSTPEFAADVAGAVACATKSKGSVDAPSSAPTQQPITYRYYICPRCHTAFGLAMASEGFYSHPCPWSSQPMTMSGSEWARHFHYY